MIIKAILTPFWWLLDFIITLLPATPLGTVSNLSAVLEVASYGISILGLAQFIKVIGSICTWHTVHIAWTIVEFILKKIPGVD